MARNLIPALILPAVLAVNGLAVAQPKLAETPSLEKSYRLDIRILTSPDARARVRAQDWSRLFEKLDLRVTIASDNGRERPGIHVEPNRQNHTLRAVGVMDQTGNVLFGKQRFRLTDDKAIQAYFDELTKHGPGGPIRERSTWGLSDEQFEELLTQLATPCGVTTEASSAVDLVSAFELPDGFQFTWSKAAHHAAVAVEDDPATLNFDRLSTGTALAAGLAQFGLGFRPLPNPQGGLILEIDAGDENSNLWPVGWKNTGPMNQAAPKAFQAIAVDVEDVELDALIATIADKINVPCFYAQHALDAAGIDVTTLTYSRKPGKLSPWRLLQLVGSPHRMALELRTDEAGAIFLWCTTQQEHDAWKKRFKDVRPK